MSLTPKSVVRFAKSLRPMAEPLGVKTTCKPFDCTSAIHWLTAFELQLDMPGIAPEHIDVKLEGNQLTITAERKPDAEKNGWLRRERNTAGYARSFSLPDTLVGTKPEATYRQGVLTLTLPKREETQPRSFKVKVEA